MRNGQSARRLGGGKVHAGKRTSSCWKEGNPRGGKNSNRNKGRRGEIVGDQKKKALRSIRLLKHAKGAPAGIEHEGKK